MKLIVGLGNPGKEYAATRHNMGFMAIDEFADMAGFLFDRRMFNGEYVLIKEGRLPEPVLLLKPQTFMNLSGECVQPFASYFKIDIADIVVIYDEMALAEGDIRLRLSGSSGGHKGMQSIIDRFGNEQIKRIRIGIGEPPSHNPVDYVLGRPQGDSLKKTEAATHRAAQAVRDILLYGFEKAMNVYNQKPK